MPMVVPGRVRVAAAPHRTRGRRPRRSRPAGPHGRCGRSSAQQAAARSAHDLRRFLVTVVETGSLAGIERIVRLLVVVIREGIDLGQRGRRLTNVELAGHDIGDEARAVFA